MAMTMWINKKWIFIFLGIAYLLWHLFYLDKYPIIDLDDSWMAVPSWEFIHTGNFGSPMLEGIYGLEKSNIYHGRIHMFFQIPFFLGFGLGAYQARFPSFLTALVVLYLTYLLGKVFYSQSVALLSCFLLSLSGIFIITSHRGRQDIFLSLFILLAIFIYLKAKEKNSSFLCFLSGLTAGLSIDIHLNGIIVPIFIIVLFLFDSKKNIFEKKFWIAFSGISLGIFWWIITHILPDIDLFVNQWNAIVLGKFSTPIYSTSFNLINMLISEVNRYKQWFWDATGHRNMIELFLLLSGIVTSIIFGKSKNKYLLLILSTFVTVFVIIVRQKVPYYLIYMYPFFILLFCKGVEIVSDKNRFISKTLYLLLAGFYFLQLSYISLKYKDINYNKYISNVKKFVPLNSTVLGDSILWFGFADKKIYKFFADASYLHHVQVKKMTPESFIQDKKIDYIIFGEEQTNRYFSQNFIKSNCVLVDTIIDKYFGAQLKIIPGKIYKTKIYKVMDSAAKKIPQPPDSSSVSVRTIQGGH